MQLLRPSRRPLVLLLTLALVALSAPARAALPTSAPSDTHRCANGKTAKAWIRFGPDARVARLAADNPCKGQWIRFRFPGVSVSDPYGLDVFVAPGLRINWKGQRLVEWGLAGWAEGEYGGTGLVAPKATCVSNYDGVNGWTGKRGLLVFSDKDVRDAPECGRPVPKYSANHHASVPCPSGENSTWLTWKMDGKKIVKLAINSDCSANWSIAWWRLDNGRRVAVWVEPGESTDLWKSELDGLPTKTKDGKVFLGYDRTLGTDADDFGGRNPKDRPFYYNAVANGDTVR